LVAVAVVDAVEVVVRDLPVIRWTLADQLTRTSKQCCSPLSMVIHSQSLMHAPPPPLTPPTPLFRVKGHPLVYEICSKKMFENVVRKK